MDGQSLFSEQEANAITSSWNTLTKDGVLGVGQLILHRLFQDVPEVRTLFYKIGVDDADEKTYSMGSLKQNDQFNSHARRVASNLDGIVKKLTNTTFIVQKCTNLGRAHKKHNVKPHYFDLLGQVLVKVLCQALKVDETDETIRAWIKAYGAIAGALKKGLTE